MRTPDLGLHGCARRTRCDANGKPESEENVGLKERHWFALERPQDGDREASVCIRKTATRHKCRERRVGFIERKVRNFKAAQTEERKVGFTKNTATRHRRVGGRAVTVTAMLHRQRYRVIEKEKTR